ncbi:MAG: hypothetical protein R3258_01050 [Acidimicrobiia bacterium]|nr:hypothetical protein [Acidimicrobiia bacterium]
MLLTGLLLVSGVLVVVIQTPGYRRGGFDGAFWRLPLADQLDQIGEKNREWWWVAGWSVVGVVLMTGGLVSLAALLGEAGEPALSFSGAGVYLVAMAAWMFGLAVSYAAMSEAAKQKRATGETPSWVAPLGSAAYVSEVTWVIAANLAYILVGVAVLATGLLPSWAGWSAVGIGAGLAVLVALTRYAFPQMSDLAPFALGVAAILEAL